MPWYPNLTGQVAPQVEDAIRRLYTQHYELQAALDKMRPPGSSNGGVNVAKSLQVGGANALNVTGLIGSLAQPQLAKAPLYAALPGTTDLITRDGAIIFFSGSLYRYDEAAGVWTAV